MREPKKETVEHEGGLGVVISRDEYREYEELQAKRDRSECSLRAQMRMQNQAAINLSRKVTKIVELAGLDNLAALAGTVANDAYELANDILAEEQA